ncbi:hypothetical protein I316_03996 [Kwoniella heveanensis BCC8398]|uniref:HPP transmembrane region domain-containing protein n=1 Tax=Kwoniella heveanensis BCC8398 TaxID=1296120 RepID=A0A1B9GTV9_9TREE|nr:hypothetical protein I316_03996 [Kwoniella heveanensis BCC8398]
MDRQSRFDSHADGAAAGPSSRSLSTATTLRPSPSPHHRSSSRGARRRSPSPRRLRAVPEGGTSTVIAPEAKKNPGGSSTGSAGPSSDPTSIAIRHSRWLLAEDYRERIPPMISRFIGYRPPGAVPPYEPLPFPPFSWLKHIDLKYEVWIFAFIGSLGAILLVEAIASTDTAFREVYHSPLVITSFGAAAVLCFGVIESPLAQPRNHIIGNFFGALIGTILTRLFTLHGGGAEYRGFLENTEFHGSTFVNGGLVVSVTLLVTLMLGVVHPPAGATALAAATDMHVVPMSWRYIPVVLVSSILVIIWAMIINNLGRRRYPVYWWAPQRCFVVSDAPRTRESEELALKTLEEGKLRKAEDGGRTAEDLLVRRMEGRGGTMNDLDHAADGSSPDVNRSGLERRPSHWGGTMEPLYKVMSASDRERAEGR